MLAVRPPFLCRKLDVTNKITFVATAAFEAARRIDELPAGHRARQLHGHGFLASLRCCPPPESAPFPGGELDSLQATLAPAAAQLDYQLLNDQVPSPTNPHIARWVQSQCAVPGLSAVALQSTTTEGCEVSASGQVQLVAPLRFSLRPPPAQCARRPQVRQYARPRL